MADARKVVPHIQFWEGGFVNNIYDRGGATMRGVTLRTFQQFYGSHQTVDTLKQITTEQWLHIFKVGYWDKCSADNIDNQSIANAIVDWAYNSGPTNAIKAVQRIVGQKADGIVGPLTLAAINAEDPRKLFIAIHNARIRFVQAIVERDPTQKIFLNGWLNRINSIAYEG